MPGVGQELAGQLSLTAVGAWGTSDFLGGIGARRGNVFLFTSFVHLSGMALAGTLAFAIGLPFPDAHSVLWSLAAGAIGGIGLALFYRGLAIGQMGIVAPVSAVLGAALATVVAAVALLLFGPVHLAAAVALGVGLLMGSAVGPSVARKVSSNVLRIVAGILGIALAAWLFVTPSA